LFGLRFQDPHRTVGRPQPVLVRPLSASRMTFGALG
jgi:hypothetical protein